MFSCFKVFHVPVSFRQAGNEIPNFLGLEHAFQFRARTVRAFRLVVAVLVHFGLGRRLAPAQEAPSLTRSVRRGRHGRLIVAVLADPRFLGGPHGRRRGIRVVLAPVGPSEQWVDGRDGRGDQTDADLHVGEERDQRVVPGDVDGAHPDD